MAGNAFTHIADGQRAQRISDGWEAKRIHERPNELARLCCPICRDFATGYPWSVDRCEYATDIVSRDRGTCEPYMTIWRAPQSTRGNRTPSPPFSAASSARSSKARWAMASRSASKGRGSNTPWGRFRSSCTASSASFSESRPRSTIRPFSSTTVRRSKIRASGGANSTSLLNRWDGRAAGTPGSIVRGEFNIGGLQNKTLRRHLPELASGTVSRLLNRLRTQGLVKKAGRADKYYVTQLGKGVIATALKLRELVTIPQLAFASPAESDFPGRECKDRNGKVLRTRQRKTRR